MDILTNSPRILQAHCQSRTSQLADQSLQKSVLFPNQRRNSIFFLPNLLCFNFFATAQPKTDKQSNSLLQPLDRQSILTRTKEARTGNMRLASCGVTCLHSSSVFQLGFGGGLTLLYPEIPHERKTQTVRIINNHHNHYKKWKPGTF